MNAWVAFAIVLETILNAVVNREPSATPESFTAAAKANQMFTIDLLKRLLKEDENVFLSPFSISSAVALLSLGAKGNTLDEIEKAFHFDLIKEANGSVHRVYKELNELYNADNAEYSLSTANRVFGDNCFEVIQSFQKNAKKYYQAELEQLDFKSGNAEGVINQWVEQQTNNKIKDLIPDNSLESAMLVLVNAIYFKGTWVTKFKKENTKRKPFHLNNSHQKDVDMMTVTSNFKYYHDKNFNVKALELPYDGGDLSMIAILPDDIEGLGALIKNLNEWTLTNLLDRLVRRRVEVKFPKFKLETTYALKDNLALLGIHDLFGKRANLSALTKQPLEVSKVIHKAFIETDEQGTRAAAATAIQAYTRSSAVPPPPPIFNADRPFFFSIVHRKSNFILFTGLLVNP